MSMDTTSRSLLHRALRPAWVDLAPLVLGEGASLDHSTARLWSLVLASRHVPHRMRQQPGAIGGGFTIQVQQWFAERAEEEIRLYLAENDPGLGLVVLPDLRPVSGLEPTMVGMGIMVLFFWMYTRTYPGLGLYPELWLKLGSARAAAILSGEWWRTVTALTLHGDGAHVVGNALIGGVFVWLVSRRLGAGLTWMLTLLAGALGNAVNALVLGGAHNAIGFSTASFAAAGILAAIAPFKVGGGMHGLGSGSLGRRVYECIRSALVPVGAGLGLLAMLGAGEDTDLGAHLFGFLCGLVAGGLTGLVATRLGLPSRRLDGALYALALALPVCCWWRAWLA